MLYSFAIFNFSTILYNPLIFIKETIKVHYICSVYAYFKSCNTPTISINEPLTDYDMYSPIVSNFRTA